MSPRPRKASDDEILGALVRVMQRVKPDALTLAAVAEEAGLTAGALVQRFGSKRDLLRALNASFAGDTGAMLADMRAQSDSPLAAIRAHADQVAAMASSPEALAHHLAYLQVDLSDPEMFAQVRSHTRALRRAMTGWLREAVRDGALRPGTDPRRLARIVHTTIAGSMMLSIFFDESTSRRAIRRDLDLVLEPYLPER